MSRIVSFLLAIGLSGFICAQSASATIRDCTSTLIAFGVSQTSSGTANVVYFNSCSFWAYCSGNYAYIDFSDRQLFAYAMTSVANGATITTTIDDGATAKGDPNLTNGVTTCKVIRIRNY